MRRQSSGGGEAGFSLIELMVAMGVTLIIMTLASTVLMECFNIRSRQDTRAAAPAAALITNVRNAAGTAESEVAPNLAKYVVVVIVVRLDAIGSRGTEGYQPETQEMLVSDVALRNNDLTNY